MYILGVLRKTKKTCFTFCLVCNLLQEFYTSFRFRKQLYLCWGIVEKPITLAVRGFCFYLNLFEIQISQRKTKTTRHVFVCHQQFTSILLQYFVQNSHKQTYLCLPLNVFSHYSKKVQRRTKTYRHVSRWHILFLATVQKSSVQN